MVRSPLVTVIIATYNRKHYVCEAIDSVLGQTYPHVELIVIDDGSTDGTSDLLRDRYGQRIRYVFQPNQGRSEARNHGMRLAGGEYIAFLDSDDLWEPDKLTRQLAFMQANPQYGLTHTFTSIIDSDGRPAPADTEIRLGYHRAGVRSGYTYVAMASRCTMFLSTVMVQTSLIPRIGYMDREIPAFEDWDWYLRAALVTEIGVLTEPLTRYRLHDSNSTHAEFLNGERQTSFKHLELCTTLPQPLRRRAQARFYMHLAGTAYKQEDNIECARFLRQAARFDPWLLMHPNYLRYTAAAFGPHRLITRLRYLKRSLQS
jgi:glycosyltransferase involved in cell wall biosynthesis